MRIQTCYSGTPGWATHTYPPLQSGCKVAWAEMETTMRDRWASRTMVEHDEVLKSSSLISGDAGVMLLFCALRYPSQSSWFTLRRSER